MTMTHIPKKTVMISTIRARYMHNAMKLMMLSISARTFHWVMHVNLFRLFRQWDSKGNAQWAGQGIRALLKSKFRRGHRSEYSQLPFDGSSGRFWPGGGKTKDITINPNTIIPLLHLTITPQNIRPVCSICGAPVPLQPPCSLGMFSSEPFLHQNHAFCNTEGIGVARAVVCLILQLRFGKFLEDGIFVEMR